MDAENDIGKHVGWVKGNTKINGRVCTCEKREKKGLHVRRPLRSLLNHQRF